MQDKEKEDIPDYVGHRQRLKARFVADSGRTMPEYELLELVLTYAIPRRDVKPLAKALLRRYGCLGNILAAPIAELVEFEGVGSNVAVLFSLIHACCNKINWANLDNKDTPVLSDMGALVEYCRSSIGYADQEQILMIFLTLHGQYINHEIIQVGTLDKVMLSPREIVKYALTNHAAEVIMVHNHPSGNCTPSKADIVMTKQAQDALKTVDIVLKDHIIVSKTDYYSFKERLPFLNQ